MVPLSDFMALVTIESGVVVRCSAWLGWMEGLLSPWWTGGLL